jgi:hypothetical protein
MTHCQVRGTGRGTGTGMIQLKVILKYQGGSKLTYPLDMVAIFIIDRHKIEPNRFKRPPKMFN